MLSHEVFISYAHEDAECAESIVLGLRAGGFSVFWDRDLEPGEDWRRRLLEALHATRLAVVVLWSHASVNSDFVVDEADRAAARKHLLVPTRIDDATLPLGFGRLQTLLLNCSNATELLLPKLEARRRGVDKPDPFPIFLLRRTLRVAVAVAVSVILLLAGGLPDRLFGIDTSLRLVSIWVRNAVLSPPPTPLTFVSIGQPTIAQLGKLGPSYRDRHAELVRGLSRHRARVAAFDLYFPPPDVVPDEAVEKRTADLARAIEQARRRGVGVVVGEEKRGETHPLIQDALAAQAQGIGYAANLCVGLKGKYAITAALLVARSGENSPHEAVLSLPLAAFAGTVGAYVTHPSWPDGECCISLPSGDAKLAPELVIVSERDDLREVDVEHCRFLEKGSDVVATLILELPKEPRYRNGERAGVDAAKGVAGGPKVVEYSALLDLFDREQHGQTEPEREHAALAARSLVENRLVLVAPRIAGSDSYPVFGWHGDHVWGSELHAYAIETLFSRRTLRVASQGAHLVLLVLMMVLAGAARLVLRSSPRKRRAALIVLLAANAALVLLASVLWDYSMDGVYPALAIVLSHLASGYYLSPLIPEKRVP